MADKKVSYDVACALRGPDVDDAGALKELFAYRLRSLVRTQLYAHRIVAPTNPTPYISVRAFADAIGCVRRCAMRKCPHCSEGLCHYLLHVATAYSELAEELAPPHYAEAVWRVIWAKVLRYALRWVDPEDTDKWHARIKMRWSDLAAEMRGASGLGMFTYVAAAETTDRAVLDMALAGKVVEVGTINLEWAPVGGAL